MDKSAYVQKYLDDVLTDAYDSSTNGNASVSASLLFPCQNFESEISREIPLESISYDIKSNQMIEFGSKLKFLHNLQYNMKNAVLKIDITFLKSIQKDGLNASNNVLTLLNETDLLCTVFGHFFTKPYEWKRRLKVISQNAIATKTRILVEWHFVTSDNAQHTIVLQHTQETGKIKTRRMLWVDGSERYNNKSSASSFRVEIGQDVVVPQIDKSSDSQKYEYRLTINGRTYDEALQDWKVKQSL